MLEENNQKKTINPFNKDRSKKVKEQSNATAAGEDYQIIPIRKPTGDGFIRAKGKNKYAIILYCTEFSFSQWNFLNR